ncbi:MAG: hypothetical protein KGJ02_07060 [Verrucomicrobiota bacterium]|nr:hypothetical protein [Verrucomicrobiota bacterium]
MSVINQDPKLTSATLKLFGELNLATSLPAIPEKPPLILPPLKPQLPDIPQSLKDRAKTLETALTDAQDHSKRNKVLGLLKTALSISMLAGAILGGLFLSGGMIAIPITLGGSAFLLLNSIYAVSAHREKNKYSNNEHTSNIYLRDFFIGFVYPILLSFSRITLIQDALTLKQNELNALNQQANQLQETHQKTLADITAQEQTVQEQWKASRTKALNDTIAQLKTSLSTIQCQQVALKTLSEVMQDATLKCWEKCKPEIDLKEQAAKTDKSIKQADQNLKQIQVSKKYISSAKQLLSMPPAYHLKVLSGIQENFQLIWKAEPDLEARRAQRGYSHLSRLPNLQEAERYLAAMANLQSSLQKMAPLEQNVQEVLAYYKNLS